MDITYVGSLVVVACDGWGRGYDERIDGGPVEERVADIAGGPDIGVYSDGGYDMDGVGCCAHINISWTRPNVAKIVFGYHMCRVLGDLSADGKLVDHDSDYRCRFHGDRRGAWLQ